MSLGEFKPCVVIPHYNHQLVLPDVLNELSLKGLPIIVVDDASEAMARSTISAHIETMRDTRLVQHVYNLGKGGAVLTGCRVARQAGFSHAVQVDADGQHCLDDIERFIGAAANQPQAIISGAPVFDGSISAARLWGRRLTHFWVAVETLSLRVKDAMCGFRVYPLDVLQKLTEQYSLGTRMDFDIEVLVKADWQRVPLVYLPTAVHYPVNGVSHFDYLRDNWKIICLHTRLVCGMLLRLPKLLSRRVATNA